MRKCEFLRQIKNELRRYDKSETDKITAYYDELINDKVDSGLNEKDAVASLGDLKNIIESVKSELLFERSKNKSKRGWKTAALILGICATPVLLPIGIVFFVIILVFFVIYGSLLLAFGSAGIACTVGLIPALIIMGLKGYSAASIVFQGGEMLVGGGIMILLVLFTLKFGQIVLQIINKVFSGLIKRRVKGGQVQ